MFDSLRTIWITLREYRSWRLIIKIEGEIIGTIETVDITLESDA